MTEAHLTELGDGRWELSGRLDFNSVPRLWPALAAALKKGGNLTLSLSGVGHANSAGLVMLVEARDVARRVGCRLRMIDVPGELLDLARMSRCEELVSENAV